MKKSKFNSQIKLVTIIPVISLMAFGLNGCGSGSNSDSEASAATVRPKSMDSLYLTLDSAMRFELFRTTGTSPAVENGSVETGSFFYTRVGDQRTSNQNAVGTTTGVSRPDEISGATYSYRAINDTSGVLTLNGVAVDDGIVQGGEFNSLSGRNVRLFDRSNNGTTINTIVIDLTFSSNGSFITTNDVTVVQPGGDPVDDLIMPSTITLNTGGPVPVNYNPSGVDTRDSVISAESLDNLLVQFTNGIPDSTKDFTIQFVADAVGSGSADEIGQGLLRIGGTSVDNAVDYTWTRTGGTDNGTLVLSGSNTTFDGSYTLSFSSVDVGIYTGEVDADTTSAADVSGTFAIPSL